MMLAVTVADITGVVFTLVAVATGEIVTLGLDPIATSSYKLMDQEPPAIVELSPNGQEADKSASDPRTRNMLTYLKRASYTCPRRSQTRGNPRRSIGLHSEGQTTSYPPVWRCPRTKRQSFREQSTSQSS